MTTNPTGYDPRVRTLRLESVEVLLLSVPVAAAPSAVLTPAELAVARRAALGQSNRAIARARGSSPRTVANQIAAIFGKLGVRSRALLASRLAQMALVGDAP